MKKLSGPIALIKKSLSVFFEKPNMIFLMKIYLVLLPFSIFSAYQSFNLNQSENVSISLWVAVVNILYVFIYFWITASSIEAVRRVLAGESLDVPATLKFGWSKYGKFLILGLLLTVIYVFGFILLIIPGFIFIIWFSFANFILISEKVGVKEALAKSKSLVSGRFFAILGRFAVFALFGLLVQIIVSLIPYVGNHILVLFGGLFMLPSFLLYKELSVK